MAWNRTNQSEQPLSEQSKTNGAELTAPHLAGNPDNPIVDEYAGKPITKEGQEMLKEPVKFLEYLQDTYSAAVLHELNLPIPKWKQFHKTKQEALESIKDALEKKFGQQKSDKEVDYSTWH